MENLELERSPILKVVEIGDEYPLRQVKIIDQQSWLAKGMEANNFLVPMSERKKLATMNFLGPT